MTTLETLRECHRIVWTARRELEAVWPTPSTEDALLFAFTELGEAIDAHLRLNSGYARNHAKELDVLDELADCAMMLLTAQSQVVTTLSYPGLDTFGWSEGKRFRRIIFYVSQAYSTYWPGNQYSPFHSADLALSLISQWPGMDLPARLTARLDRIRRKRLPQSEAADLDLEYTWLNQAGSL